MPVYGVRWTNSEIVFLYMNFSFQVLCVIDPSLPDAYTSESETLESLNGEEIMASYDVAFKNNRSRQFIVIVEI